jgi:hypothetical protein
MVDFGRQIALQSVEAKVAHGLGEPIEVHRLHDVAVMIGLIAHLIGVALQEDIASITGRLIAKGQALTGPKSSDDCQSWGNDLSGHLSTLDNRWLRVT